MKFACKVKIQHGIVAQFGNQMQAYLFDPLRCAIVDQRAIVNEGEGIAKTRIFILRYLIFDLSYFIYPPPYCESYSFYSHMLVFGIA